ncbi:MAG: hypothetical protein ACM3ML_24445 [Micromonosporaceae bacterium]
MKRDRLHLRGLEAAAACDENTIARTWRMWRSSGSSCATVSADLADLLLGDIRMHAEALAKHDHPKLPLMPGRARQSFAH